MRWLRGSRTSRYVTLHWRLFLGVGVFALAASVPAVVASLTPGRPASAGQEPELQLTGGYSRATPGGDIDRGKPSAVRADPTKPPKPGRLSNPAVLHLTRAASRVFDVRALKSTVVREEWPEHEDPFGGEGDRESNGGGHESNAGGRESNAAAPSRAGNATPSALAPAPAPTASFEGLDFANWGTGHPPDPNGDVGPIYYIQTINTSIGIYDKSNGNRVAAFTFNAFMSQGNFGNLCDTANRADPVVLYDSFEDRWFITDFAFLRDASNNINPQTVYQCFAVSKSGDPVAGGWNFYSILSPGGLDDYPKFGVWPDGIYMSANMFGYAAGSAFIAPHVWALNKAEMYAGAPSVSVIDFPAPADDFTVLPGNARLQAGTPPPGTPEYFVSTEQFTNAVGVYKLHADWDKISTSTFSGPEIAFNATSWPNAAVPNAPTPGNNLDTLQIRAMAELEYSNIGGVESLWATHTVRRADTSGSAAPRWYQLNVTGGTVQANTVQGTTWDPEGANTFYRFMPSLAVDRMGDLALGYSKSNATTNPQIKYAGRLAADAANTFSQDEQTLIDGTGTQSGTCGSPPSACIRWGDYSGMALDPDGCTFWETNEYYKVTGLSFNTRIGSFKFPGCTTVGNGTLSGTVSDASGPLPGATVTLGTRKATTDGSGAYSFNVPAGTYPQLTAAKAGFDPSSATSLVVPNGGTLTRNFTLSAAVTSGCFTDNTQSTFQRGVPSGCDLTASPGNVRLTGQDTLDQKNETLGTFGGGITTTTYGGQTFTPALSGPLTKAEVNLFCAGCTGTTPDLTLSIRATSGGLPTGADLATATIPGFSGSGFFTGTFAAPLAVTAGTQYAIVIRPTANPSAGSYALTRSGTQTAGEDVYPGGTRVAGVSSGTVWVIPATGGVTTDAGFRIYIRTGFPSSGTFVSSLKDANPAANRTPHWTSFTYSATKPAGTDVKFQVAASNSSYGPFNYVGPDGTAATFFTTSGASLSRFDGFRYLRYKAYLTTGDATITPTLSMVAMCFNDVLKVSTVGTIAVGTTPTGVAVGASRAYVANQGSNSVSVINLTQSPPALAATIPVGGMPDSAALSADGSRLYVANFQDGTLSIIATATNSVSKTVAVGSRPTGVTEVGGSVYVANLLSGTISVIDPVAGSVTRTISLPGAGTATGAAPSGLAASGDGHRLYVNDARNGRTYVIDLTQVPPVVGAFAAVGLRPAYLSLAGSTGYVANPGSNSVSVLDLSQSAPVTMGSVTVGSSPYGVAASSSLKEVFVANSGSNNLSVIDTSGAPTVAFTIAAGATPDAIALSPDQQTVVVSNEGDNTVSVFHADQAPANVAQAAQAAIQDAAPSADDELQVSGLNQNPTADRGPGAAAVNGPPGVAQGPLGLVPTPHR